MQSLQPTPGTRSPRTPPDLPTTTTTTSASSPLLPSHRHQEPKDPL
jgi:hypothetical protein